jgi:hypothetical protein
MQLKKHYQLKSSPKRTIPITSDSCACYLEQSDGNGQSVVLEHGGHNAEDSVQEEGGYADEEQQVVE